MRTKLKPSRGPEANNFTIVVCCGAGVSRSPLIAKKIAKELSGEDIDFYEQFDTSLATPEGLEFNLSVRSLFGTSKTVGLDEIDEADLFITPIPDPTRIGDEAVQLAFMYREGSFERAVKAVQEGRYLTLDSEGNVTPSVCDDIKTIIRRHYEKEKE